ncbi:MAG: DUF1731 domain-containing protein [Ilumatobacteraceae bacterium]
MSASESACVPAATRVFIAGGTGLIGRQLVAAWRARGVDIVVSSRRPRPSEPGVDYVVWDPATGPAPAAELHRCDIVHNLIGETIGASRWSRAKRRSLRDSRIESTRKIVAALGGKTRVFVNASAVTAYPGDGLEYPEDRPVPLPTTPSFINTMTHDWEETAHRADAAIRVVVARIGVVIAAEGMLAGVLPLFRWRIGRFLGSPETPVPWVDARDLARLLVHLAVTESSGSFNLVGPTSPPFSEFADAVQAVIGRRSWFGLPAAVVRATLGKDAAELVLARYQVRPDRALASGFVFEHTDLRRSIREALDR